MDKNIKHSEKGIELKSIEYPVIYSYIYERESEDIKRLFNKFKNTRIRKPAAVEVKTITSFRIDKNGKLQPVYETINKPSPAEAKRKVYSPKTKPSQIRKNAVRKPKPSED